MKQRIWLFGIALTVLALLLVACGPGTSAPGDDAQAVEGFVRNADGYADITVQQLAELLEDTDLTLVNVHIPYQGELPQTDLFIPYDEIAENLGHLPDKDAPIVLYCRSGGMSTAAAQEFVSLGYTNVLEVDGGFNAWKAAGHELLNESR